jgi:hypothetical protein
MNIWTEFSPHKMHVSLRVCHALGTFVENVTVGWADTVRAAPPNRVWISDYYTDKYGPSDPISSALIMFLFDVARVKLKWRYESADK